MPERKKTKSASSHAFIHSVLVFTVGLLVVWLVSSWYSKQLLDDQRIKVHERIMPYANALSDSISKSLGLIDSQEAFIAVSFSEPDFMKKFKAFAFGIFAANPGIRALEVFPPRGAEIIFPQAGNEAVANGSLDNLLNDPRPAVRADVAKTIESKKIILSEPYQLLQGGLGLVARKAIYIQGKFWGLTSLVLDMPSLLERAGLRFSEMKDLDIALSDSNGTVFAGKQNVVSASPVIIDVRLQGQNQKWKLAAIPATGWGRTYIRNLRIFQILGALVVALLACILYILSNQKYRLRLTVERKTGELRENEAMLIETQRLGRMGGWTFDIQSNKINWSDQVFELYQRDPALGPPSVEEEARYYSPETARKLQELAERAIKEGLSSSYDFQIKLPGVDIAYFSASVQPVKNDEGKIIKLFGIVQDITERKKIEDDLRESEIRYRNLLEYAPVGIAVHSGGKIVFTNPAGAKLLGASTREELIGRPITEIIHPDGYEKAKQRIERMMAGEKGLYPTEDVYVRLDGTSIDVLVMATPLVYKGIDAVQVVVSDVSELKKAEREIRLLNEELENRVRERTAQLESANSELEAFTYSVSHDLRAPVRAIASFSQMLSEGNSDKLDEEGRHYLSTIQRNAKNMGQLIDDLLALSRFGKSALHVALVDMGELARSVYEEITSEEARRKIDFRLASIPPIYADPDLIHQVVVNLLSNAVKFSSKTDHPLIVMNATDEGDETIYSVSDNGAGFDMAYADKLFGVFQRLHNAHEFEGTGIGLAIVKRIILLHGGRVWAASEPGKGAVFYFSLKKTEAA